MLNASLSELINSEEIRQQFWVKTASQYGAEFANPITLGAGNWVVGFRSVSDYPFMVVNDTGNIHVMGKYFAATRLNLSEQHTIHLQVATSSQVSISNVEWFRHAFFAIKT